MADGGNATRERVGWDELGRWLAPWLLVALLAALAVIGLMLAARSDEATLQATGYALFGSGLAFLFWNLKHYFDSRECRPPA